jgi:hypothetical protein
MKLIHIADKQIDGMIAIDCKRSFCALYICQISKQKTYLKNNFSAVRSFIDNS